MWKLISRMSLSFALLAGIVAVADEKPAAPGKPATVEKPSVSVEFCGRVRHGMMTIGGETTGTTISCKRIIWEAQLHTDADRVFAKTHHKKTIVINGSLRKIAGIESKDRWVIDVKKLSELQDANRQPGVRVSMSGKLIAADSKDGSAASMTIDSAGLILPVDFDTDVKLKTAAKAMLGQYVHVVGDLQQPGEEKSSTESAIRVRMIKTRPSSPSKP